jgi:kelch-like protein 18
MSIINSFKSKSIDYSNSTYENYTDPNRFDNGFRQMEEIRRNGKLCDITLVVKEHKFTAHRIVLASSIPYFNAMFLNEMIEAKQDTIHLNDVDPNALEQLINYSYNGTININNENVQNLLIASNFFHLKNIKIACCEFIKKRLNIHDVLSIRIFADQLMCHDLIRCCNFFINKNFNKLVQTNSFLELNSFQLVDLLKRDELNVDSEEQCYEALITWLKHDLDKRKEYLTDLLKLIRLPLISVEYLYENIKNETLIRENLSARDIFDEAYYFHLLPSKRNELKIFKSIKPRCCTDSFGLIYVIGGLNHTGGSQSTVEVYDCLMDSWRLVESMITSRSRVAVAVLQNKLFAIGGYNGLERLSTVEVFESDVKRWKKIASISKPRSALGSAVLNNRLYVCGGYDGFQSSDTVEVYNPVNDK